MEEEEQEEVEEEEVEKEKVSARKKRCQRYSKAEEQGRPAQTNSKRSAAAQRREETKNYKKEKKAPNVTLSFPTQAQRSTLAAARTQHEQAAKPY